MSCEPPNKALHSDAPKSGAPVSFDVMQIKFSDGKDLAHLARKLRRSPDDASELS
jgi:hypothetical protein